MKKINCLFNSQYLFIPFKNLLKFDHIFNIYLILFLIFMAIYNFLEINKFYVVIIPLILNYLFRLSLVLHKRNLILFNIYNNLMIGFSFFTTGFLSSYILNNITINNKLISERFILFYSLCFFILNLLLKYKNFLKNNLNK